MKRIISALLALLLVFTLFGCGKQRRQIVQLTLSTEDSEAILKAAGIMLPDAEAAPAAGSTVIFYSWSDNFHNYSDDEIINTGYWTFKNKYNCEVEWYECTYGDRFDGLANLTLSSNAPDFYPAYPEAFPERPLKKMFQPVDTYIDYDDPLWSGMKDYVYSYFSLNDRPYLIGTDSHAGPVCAYNRRVVNEWGFDDPAELYYNDEWTWDRFYNMCLEFTEPDDNRYALDGWSYSIALMYSSGASVLGFDKETRRYYDNSDDPRLERAADLLYNLGKNQCTISGLRYGSEGGGIKEGLKLFYIRHDYAFTGPVADISATWGDIAAGEVMFCPLPRDDNGDGEYYLLSMPSGYLMVKGASNPEGVALLSACERFKVIDPTVMDIDRRQKQDIYLWNDEMLNMWDICYGIANNPQTALIDYEGGIGSQLSGIVSQFTCMGMSSDPKTWAQLKESNSEKLAYYIDDLNTRIDAMVDDQ